MKYDEHLDALIWALAGKSLESNQELTRVRGEVLAVAECAKQERHGSIESIAARALQAVEGALEGAGSLEETRTTLMALIEAVSAPQPVEAAPTASEESDLLSMFLSSCGDNLDGIEHLLLLAGDGALTADSLAELRRLIHTFKGECGVLSLHHAQMVCHEAESMLDRVIEEGTEVPVDTLFELVDWCRKYVADLGQNQEATPPPYADLVKAIEAHGTGSQAPAAPFAPAQAKDPAPKPVETDEELVAFPPEMAEDDTLPEFLSEAMQHLEDAEAALLALDQDPESSEFINRIFRAFHTIKGVGGFLGLDSICALAHSSESLLDRFRREELKFHAGYGDLVLQAKDMMAQLLAGLAGQGAPRRSALRSLIEAIDKACKGGQMPVRTSSQKLQAVLATPQPSGEDLAETVAASPSMAVSRIGEVLVASGLITAEVRDHALSHQEALLRSGKQLRLGEVLVELGMLTHEQVEAALGGTTAQFAAARKLLETSIAQPAQARASVAMDTTIKVNTQRLDMLVDLVGELVIAQQMVLQDPHLLQSESEQLRRNLSQLTKITRDLQEASMSLRMVTFKSTFQKMLRLVRDVSTKAGKPSRLVLEGTDTEVDRNVVDKISDPLVHLLRNAIDHGLEDAATRKARGKPAEGTITLAARHQSGSIVISIRDDGGGLSRDKILAKAVEKEILPADVRPEEMSDADVYQLIFQAGFSTAQAVTDISGRGVGMDVVRRNIEAMRGRVDIQSELGVGTTFLITLPLTLAIIDAMVVRSGDERYVLPTLSIVQSFQASDNQLQSISEGLSMVDIRGTLVPVRGLQDVLHNRRQAISCDASTLILIESARRQVCLAVDEILGQQQVVIKNLGKGLPPLTRISGGAILGDGRVALIVDTDELIAETESAQVR